MDAGVDGVMRRCCEQSMRIMRDNKESLLTIIEVALSPPNAQYAPLTLYVLSMYLLNEPPGGVLSNVCAP